MTSSAGWSVCPESGWLPPCPSVTGLETLPGAPVRGKALQFTDNYHFYQWQPSSECWLKEFGVYIWKLEFTHFGGWLHQTLLAEPWMARDERGVCIEIQTHNPVINTTQNIWTQYIVHWWALSKPTLYKQEIFLIHVAQFLWKFIFHIISKQKQKTTRDQKYHLL